MTQPTVQHLDRWLCLQILTYIMWSDVEPFWRMSTNVSSCTSCSKPQSISILEMLSIVTRRYVILSYTNAWTHRLKIMRLVTLVTTHFLHSID